MDLSSLDEFRGEVRKRLGACDFGVYPFILGVIFMHFRPLQQQQIHLGGVEPGKPLNRPTPMHEMQVCAHPTYSGCLNTDS